MGAPISIARHGTAAVSNDASASVSVAVPKTAKLGRSLLCLLVFPASKSLTVGDGWSLLVMGTTADAATKYAAVFRECSTREPAAYVFSFTGGAPASGPPLMGAMMTLVNAPSPPSMTAASAKVLAAANPVVASTSAIQTTFLDRSFTLWAATNDDGFLVDDDTEAHATGTDGARDGSLIVVSDMREQSGASVPDHPATLNAAGADVVVVQFVMVGPSPAHAVKMSASDPVGTIGLPLDGV